MKHFSKLLLILFLLPFFSLAQSNYKPGYVVTPKGDTLKGFIDYKQWNRNPTEIAFKANLNASSVESFSLKNMSAFAITGFEYYQRQTVSVSQDPVDEARLGSKSDTTYLTDTVFLHICTKGKNVILYSYTDGLKSRYYFLEMGETQPQELTFHAYYIYRQDNSTSVQYDRRYRDQLQYLAIKYGVPVGSTDEQTAHADYDESDLVKIVQKINGSSGGGFTPRGLFGIRYFAGVGANFSTIQFTGNIYFPAASIIVPKISAGFDLLPNKNIQKFFFRAEVSFASSQYKLNNSFQGDATNLDFNQYNLSIVPQAFYNLYNTSALKVFLNVGVAFNFSSYNNYNFIEDFRGISSVSLNKYPSLAKSWTSFPVKAGILLKRKFEIYAGYSPRSSISSDLSVGEVTTFQTGINYFFGVR